MVLKRFSSRSTGFTLIEVVAVLIMIGILSAVAVSHFSHDAQDVMRAMEEYKAVLRYVQSRALTTETVWGIENTQSKYRIYQVKNDEKKYTSMPGTEADDVNWIFLPDGLVFEEEHFYVSFDSWGVPYIDDMASTKQVNDRIISITGSSTVHATLVRFTGTVL